MESGVHAILGLRGHGKSRLARRLVADAPRLLVVDTLGEHSDNLARGASPEEIAGALGGDPTDYRLCLRPSGDADSAYGQVEWLERVAASRRGCCLFVDEIDRWYSSPSTPLGEGLFNLVQYGRHYDQSVVAVSRRPQRMPSDILSQATLWILPMPGRLERRVVMETSGFDPGLLDVVEKRGKHNILVQLARYGTQGVERGVFNLETGTFYFDT